jgi:hypothetical protein
VTLLAAALALTPIGQATTSSGADARTVSKLPPAGYLANSTQAVCALTGEHGRFKEQPYNYTDTKYGMIAGDSGSSFVADGQVWWLFGNTDASKHAPWGPTNKTSRWPHIIGDTAVGQGSDSIAMSPAATPPPAPVAPYDGTTPPPNQQCPVLTFITQTPTHPTAYINPSVYPDPHFATPYYVSLRRGELPEAGIEVDGNIYVVFGTDNPANCLAVASTIKGPCTSPPIGTFSTSCHGAQKGSRTRSVMAISEGGGVFKGLYDLSAPSSRYAPLCPAAPDNDDARFVNVQMQNGNDGYIYIWGTEGGANNNLSPVYLARIPTSSMATGTGIEYWDGKIFTPGPSADPQSAAKPLFTDLPNPCAAQLGVQYNTYLDEWIVLYRCNESAVPVGFPQGIFMRTANHPQGPWSKPTNIFNPAPDTKTRSGFCYYIYSAHSCPPKSRDLTLADSKNSPSPGGDYGPYFVANWVTGTKPPKGTFGVRAQTTIYYTLDTFDPYGQLIMRSTILGPRVARFHG